MTKGIYKTKTVSPEIARENALSKAKSQVHNARKHLAMQESAEVSARKNGDQKTIDRAPTAVALAKEDLARAEAELAALYA